MSNNNAVVSSSRGPVVRTHVACDAPEVCVRFPKAAGGPSLMARCTGKISSRFADMGVGALTALVAISFGAVFITFAIASKRDQAALQSQFRDLRVEQADQQARIVELEGQLQRASHNSTWPTLNYSGLQPSPLTFRPTSGGAAALVRTPASTWLKK